MYKMQKEKENNHAQVEQRLDGQMQQLNENTRKYKLSVEKLVAKKIIMDEKKKLFIEEKNEIPSRGKPVDELYEEFKFDKIDTNATTCNNLETQSFWDSLAQLDKEFEEIGSKLKKL